jgi:hypothetical protein
VLLLVVSATFALLLGLLLCCLAAVVP